jgi:hypothetical protein
MLNKEMLRINQDHLSKAVSPYYPPESAMTPHDNQQIVFSSSKEVWHWYGPLSSGETVVMVINVAHKPINILLQWRHIPSLRNSSATSFRFRDVTMGGGLEGYSSIGVGVSNLAAHGSFVLTVSENKRELDLLNIETFYHFQYNETA